MSEWTASSPGTAVLHRELAAMLAGHAVTFDEIVDAAVPEAVDEAAGADVEVESGDELLLTRQQIRAAVQRPCRLADPGLLVMVPNCLVHVLPKDPAGDVRSYSVVWRLAASYPSIADAARGMHDWLDETEYLSFLVALRQIPRNASHMLGEMGCEVTPIDVPDIDRTYDIVYTILPNDRVFVRSSIGLFGETASPDPEEMS